MTTGKVTVTRRPVWVWPLALLMIVVAAAPLVLHWLGNADDQRLVDLDVYRTGGEMVLSGRPVYDFATPAPQLLPFTYPPVAALLATLLAAMSWPVAQWVWTIGIFVTLAVTVGYGFREVLARIDRPGAAGTRPGAAGARPGAAGARPGAARTVPRAVWMPLAFAFLTVMCTYLMPIRDQVRFGQVDILLVSLCLADCVARRPVWPRGMLIGLATAVKLTPGVFLIYLLITGFGPGAREEQRRTFFMAVFTAALLTLLPFLVIPADAADFWFRALLDPERLGANAATTNQSMRGMLIRLYLPETLTSAIWLVLVAAVGWYGFRQARRSLLGGDAVTAFALVGLMASLLSPVTWIHHLAWVVVVLGAIVGDGSDPVRVRVAAGVWLYYVVPIPWWGVAIKAAEVPVLSPVVGKIVQNAFGLGAVGLVWLLSVWLPRRHAVFQSGQAGQAGTSRVAVS
ncbi:glycosyltransferase 87 family protein [Planobispora rosea]|uniref:glycosyltransferase 87 family protein n=1 Tax=Planobispora rosea TaxID=35762 RepID=UPI00083B6582|nr:glycosyltransferase 87 family protein [Planobispora rosea]